MDNTGSIQETYPKQTRGVIEITKNYIIKKFNNIQIGIKRVPRVQKKNI